MAPDDRVRWNEKYARGDHASARPSILITSLDEYIPRAGRALDVAGGAGRHAIWLAKRKLDVTLVDVSDVALQLARDRALFEQVQLNTVRADLLHEPLPAGPWDLVVSVQFLHRPLFGQYGRSLAEGGILIVSQPTRTNLLRHPKPPAEYLLNDQELPDLVSGLSILHYREGWLEEDRHDAILVARKE